MNKRSKFLQIFIALTLMLFTNAFTKEKTSTRLYGSISLQPLFQNDRSVVVPLHNLRIEIFNIPKDKDKKVGEPLSTTYPDFNGYFVFNDVPEGKYYLRISYKRRITENEIYKKEITIKYNKKGRQYLFPPIEIIITTSERIEHRNGF